MNKNVIRRNPSYTTEYTVYKELYHERRIGKRLEKSNPDFKHKFRKILYYYNSNIMKAFTVFALIFFLSCGAYAQRMHNNCYSAMPYHGKRMVSDSSRFYVKKIEAKKTENGKQRIDIRFNVPIDPRTVKKQQILIDGFSLPDETLIVFNKAGTILRIELPVPSKKTFCLELKSAESFNGTLLAQKQFDALCSDYEGTFDEPESGEEN